MLFERSLLFQSLSEVCRDYLYLFTLSLFRKGMTQKDVSLSKQVVLEIKHVWCWIKDSIKKILMRSKKYDKTTRFFSVTPLSYP
jgi:hypothetical protein